MTVLAIRCGIPSYVHVCAWTSILTYAIRANNVHAKFMVCGATKVSYILYIPLIQLQVYTDVPDLPM